MIDLICAHWLLALGGVACLFIAYLGWAIVAIIPAEEDYDPYF